MRLSNFTKAMSSDTNDAYKETIKSVLGDELASLYYLE